MTVFYPFGKSFKQEQELKQLKDVKKLIFFFSFSFFWGAGVGTDFQETKDGLK